MFWTLQYVLIFWEINTKTTNANQQLIHQQLITCVCVYF